ncbi:guanine nucleotide exchange factor [Bombardia bombarda]|uniref:Guanine nucleotide exchange factor n=1 Tax=Bombardia bombarda TaxID=252184 RepID=A0AA39WMY8_9PEZI|nr:guanine nucleotide exchange factor [Bombardia bombarda]
MSQRLQLALQGSRPASAKLQAVTTIVNRLTNDLESSNLSTQQRDTLLEELKVHGRDPRDADPIFTTKSVETLTRYGFDGPPSTTSRNALKVLCNAMLLKPDVRQIFVDLGYEDQACERLKNDNREDEFLVSRIIFLTTYGTTINLQGLIDNHGLADTICQNLARHTTQPSSKAPVDPMTDMALAETLQLLFNITRFCGDRIDAFAPAVHHLVTLLCQQDIRPTGAPLDQYFKPIIHALMNLKFDGEGAQESLFPKSEPDSVANRLIHLLDLAMKFYAEKDLEQTVSPLALVVLSLYEHAPDDVRQLMQDKLLPTEEDREKVLGRGDTLASRLLQNSTNAIAPELRKAISHLLFDMSDKDASKFIKNVGYGYASGFLFQNNIPIPDQTGSEPVGSEEKATNPITGQFLDSEKFPDVPEMSEEEKEREAERLFVLFERLKKNGVISVQNPVEQAVQEGRFEELPDDYEEDEDEDGDDKKKLARS